MKPRLSIAVGLLAVLAALLVLVLMTMQGARPQSKSGVGSSTSLRTVTGTVRAHGSPLAGARVRIKASEVSAVSDALGAFRLPVATSASNHLTARRDGYLISGADTDGDDVHFDLKPLPHDDDTSYAWVDPRPDERTTGNCANCHAEIYREWSKGGHAHSATGRYFRDLYGDETTHTNWNLLAENPDASGACAACHAPTATFKETLDLREVRGVAGQGVHCDYCHKVVDSGLEPIGLAHGRHGMQLLRPSEGQLFVGPLDDVDRGEDTYSPLYQDSKYCASCHEGTVLGVHVYSTYSEWLVSPAAKKGQQCQSCHMKPTGTMTNIAPGHGGVERRPQTLGNHTFFADSKEAMLRECLDVAVGVQEFGLGPSIGVIVRLTAKNVGHRVPTGFSDRQLILVVEALDGESRPVAPTKLTKLDVLSAAAGNDLEGKAGYIYAKLLHAPNSSEPVPFWMAGNVVKDTRLLPDKPEVYTCSFSGPVETVKVSLIYRPFWQETARTKGWGNLDTILLEKIVPKKTFRPRDG